MDKTSIQSQTHFNEEINPNNPIPIIQCPYCRKNIPSLFLTSMNGQVIIRVNCSCLKEEKALTLHQFIKDFRDNQTLNLCVFHSKKGEEYCVDCSEWLCSDCLKCHIKFTSSHIVLGYQANVRCNLHKKSFSFFCKTCGVNQCENCQPMHVEHSIMPLKKLKLLSPLPLIFEKTMKINKERIEKFVEKVDNKIASLEKMKKDLLEVYNQNEIINQDLMVLYQSICGAAKAFNEYPSFELMRLQETIDIAPEWKIEEKSNVEDEFSNLNTYYRKHYLVKQVTSLNEMKAVLTGHTNDINCLTILTDGSLVSGSNDNTIKIWDLTTNACKTTLKGHSGSIRSLLQLADGRLASGASDSVCKIWDLTTNECKASLTGHGGSVYSLANLKDGRIATGSWSQSVKLWDLTTMENKTPIPTSGNLSIISLLDGTLVISSLSTIHVWNNLTYECKGTLSDHKENVNTLLELDDNLLASGSTDKTIKIWDLKGCCLKITLKEHTKEVSSLVRIKDERMASGSLDKTVKIWNLATFECIDSLNTGAINSMTTLKDGTLAVGSNREIKIYDVSLLSYFLPI